MFSRRVIILVALILGAVGVFLSECAAFHFPYATGIDVLWLAGLTLLPGTLVVLLLRHWFAFELEAHEILSLGAAVGFGLPPLLLWLFRHAGVPDASTVYYILRSAVTLTVLVLLVTRKLRLSFRGQLRSTNDLFIFTIASLCFFAIYNLPQFHYAPDSSIVTRGIFGVDLPFLAGEIHGIRDFGSLRDLHQLGQPWHYHDWTYKILAMLPADRTLPDLAFASPLVGYTLLALSIFALAKRLTKSDYISYVATALWFLVSGIGSGELGSYALSPSFIFGSVIFLNVLLVFDLWRKTVQHRAQWVFLAILFYFLVELSQTKLSTFLVATGSLGFAMLLGRSGKKKHIRVQLLLACLISFGMVVWQNSAGNPLMPGDDFLIGAPLLGYANHLANILHVPVQSINPVSHGLHLHWQSLLILPFFLFHTLLFVCTDVKLLAGIILLVFFWKSLWKEMRELTTILVALILLGFFLPVLYSPAWYPLALSFYSPLVSVQAAFLLATVAFGVFARTPRTRTRSTAIGLVALLFVFGVAREFRSIRASDEVRPNLVSSSLVNAMNYLSMHSSNSAVIATDRFDLDSSGDESYYWYSALSGRPVVSEGADYGSLLAAHANTDAEKGLHPVPTAMELLNARRVGLDTIFHSRDSESVSKAFQSLNVSYILEQAPADAQKPPVKARLFFANSEDTIWELQ